MSRECFTEEQPTNRANEIKAEAEIALSSKEGSLHSEVVNISGPDERADNSNSEEDARAELEIALSVNPETEKDQKYFYHNAANILAKAAIERAQAK